MMKAAEFVQRIRRRHGLAEDQPVGIRGCRKVAEINESNRNVRVIATTDDVDLADEVVMPGGADPASYFFTNKSVFLDHHYRSDWLVGKMRNVSPIMAGGVHKGWAIDIQVVSTPFALDVWTIIREVGIGTSIGFIPQDNGDPTPEEKAKYPVATGIIRRWYWLEQSLTAFPCNVRCQQVSFTESETDNSKVAELDRLVTKGLIRVDSAVAMGLPAPKSLPKLVVRRRLIVGNI